MKYYLVRIDEGGKHRVVSNFTLGKSTRLIIGDTLPSGEQQYICPEILLPFVNKVSLGITTTVKALDTVFTFEEKALPDSIDAGVDIKTDIEEMR